MSASAASHLLVATDLSPAAVPALLAGASLARELPARVTLLHVLNAGSLAGAGPVCDTLQRLKTEWRQAVLPQLELLARRFLSEVPHEVALVEATSVSEAICSYARDEAVDWIVVATHGHTGVRRWILGSVAERVLRKAPCPVLAVRSDAPLDPAAHIRRILVPTDFSRCSERALEQALEIAKRHGAEIHLLHSHASVLPDGLAEAAGEPPFGSYVQRLLQSVKSKVEAQGVPARTYLSTEPPARAIVDAAWQLGIDLIVMGTHGRSGLAHLLAGSIAEPVVRTAPCSVMAVKASTAAAVPSSGRAARDASVRAVG